MGNQQLGKDDQNIEDSGQEYKVEDQKDNESSPESEEMKSEDKESMEVETNLITLTIKLQPSVVTETKPKEKTVTLSQYPKTGLDAKLFIQQEFQIPVCLQTLSLQSLEISDKQSFNQLHLRDGDILTVNFTTQGNLHEIQAILDSMKAMIKVLETSSEEIKGTLTPSTEKQLTNCLDAALVEHLIHYFTPKTSEIKNVNQLFFVHNKGIELTLHLHQLLTEIPFEKHIIEMQILESSVLGVIWVLSSITGIRCLLFQHPTAIIQLSKSLLRARILPYKRIEAPSNQHAVLYPNNQNLIVGEIIFKAMGVITNFAELSDRQLEIVNTPLLIEQMTSAMLSPSYTILCAQIVIGCFLCLSFSSDTHLQLTRPPIIHGILASCKKFSQEYMPSLSRQRVQTANIIILKHFTMLFFSLISTSPSNCVAREEFQQFLPEIISFMNKFIHRTTYQQVHEAEEQAEYHWCWCTMKPFVRLIYFHYNKDINSLAVQQIQLLKDLYLTSVRAGIFSLRNMCLSDDCKDVLVSEELTDYLTCLPWYVPEVLREDAELLVQLVNTKIKPQPPRLVNIVKGYLASYYFTLEEAMSPLFTDTLYQRLSQ